MLLIYFESFLFSYKAKEGYRSLHSSCSLPLLQKDYLCCFNFRQDRKQLFQQYASRNLKNLWRAVVPVMPSLKRFQKFVQIPLLSQPYCEFIPVLAIDSPANASAVFSVFVPFKLFSISVTCYISINVKLKMI